MSFKNLWTKLFTPDDETEEIAMHVSGATVRHKNPFEKVDVPRNSEELDEEFVDKWVVPFYMNRLSDIEDAVVKSFADAGKEITTATVRQLLGDFNWRTRIAGSYFAAINNYKELEDSIGGHLLRSEVCYAGAGYCLALATFDGEKSKNYLFTYLDYYLNRKDLWFDQADAFCALEYLDKSQADKLSDKWNAFVADKEYWSLERSREHFNDCMLTLDKIRQTKSTG